MVKNVVPETSMGCGPLFMVIVPVVVHRFAPSVRRMPWTCPVLSRTIRRSPARLGWPMNVTPGSVGSFDHTGARFAVAPVVSHALSVPSHCTAYTRSPA